MIEGKEDEGPAWEESPDGPPDPQEVPTEEPSSRSLTEAPLGDDQFRERCRKAAERARVQVGGLNGRGPD